MILAFFGLMSREETKVKLIEEPIEDADLPSDASDSPLAGTEFIFRCDRSKSNDCCRFNYSENIT